MAEVRVIYLPENNCSRNLFPYVVQEKAGFFKWEQSSRWGSELEARKAARELENKPYIGQVLYQTVCGYGD